MKILSEGIQAARRMRTLVLFAALFYIGSYATGWYLISVRSPIAVGTAQVPIELMN